VPGGGVALIRVQNHSISSKARMKTDGRHCDPTPRDRRAAPPDRGERGRGRRGHPQSGQGRQGSYGYNAATSEFGDMLEEGILDPTKVTRLALQNAPPWPHAAARPK